MSTADPESAPSHDVRAEGASRSPLYPDYLLPIAGSHGHRSAEEAAPERNERLCAIREDALLGYGYNTARAYWGDLDDLFFWAESRDKDVLDLSERDFRQYRALLRRRKYSESTVRRRATAYRHLRSLQSGGAVREL